MPRRNLGRKLHKNLKNGTQFVYLIASNSAAYLRFSFQWDGEAICIYPEGTGPELLIQSEFS